MRGQACAEETLEQREGFCAGRVREGIEAPRRERLGCSGGCDLQGWSETCGLPSWSGCSSSPECRSVVCEPLWRPFHSIRERGGFSALLPLSANTAREAAEMRIM